MSALPSFEKAKSMIQDLSLAWKEHVEAAAIVTSSKEASYDDLLACLKIRGLPAEWAACALYSRTKRTREDEKIESFILDHDDWKKYLISHEFVSKQN
jgi:hypothetical protein